MTINQNYDLRQLSKTGFVLESIDKDRLIVLNETAAFIWKSIKNGANSLDELQQVVIEKYQADEMQVSNDLNSTISQWLSIGIIHS